MKDREMQGPGRPGGGGVGGGEGGLRGGLHQVELQELQAWGSHPAQQTPEAVVTCLCTFLLTCLSTCLIRSYTS